MKDGKAWWDAGAYTWPSTGKTRPSGLRDPDGRPVFTGSGFGDWVDDAPGGRKDVHAPGESSGWCFYYGVTTNAIVNGRKDTSKNRTPEQWLAECRKVAGKLKGNRMLPDFLLNTEMLPLSSEQIAQLYREVITAHPDSPWTHRLLVRLLIAESDHAAIRRRYSLWLNCGVAYGSPAKSGYKPLRMSLVRVGHRWLPDVPGRSPTFNTSNHSGVIQDLNAPVGRIPIVMNIGSDPWVPGDKSAPYTLSLHVQNNGVVYGSYVRTFREYTLASALSGRCVAATRPRRRTAPQSLPCRPWWMFDASHEKSGVSRRQRHLFERQLARPANPADR